ncbi:MAG: hypothetical protein MJ137_01040 [Clostridia bacterium]|nr:hypothetical protein [Clostridia bacterium]
MKKHRSTAAGRGIFRTVFAAAGLLAVIISLVSCDVKVKPVKAKEWESVKVGTVSGYDILYDELRYITVGCKNDLEAKYGKGIWENPESAEAHREELEKLVKESLASSYYAVMKMADEYYIGGSERMLSEEAIEKRVNEYVNEVATEIGSKKAYLAALEENALSDRLFRFYTSLDEAASELTYILKTDLGLIPSTEKELSDYMNSDKFIRTNHIYISGLTDEKRALADELRAKLLASDDPEHELLILKGRYDADFTLTTTHGVYFARYTSDYGNAYEKTAFMLDVGGISDIVAGSEGYYVIMRLPLEPQWLTYNFEEFSEDIIGSEFNRYVNEYRDGLTFSFNEYGKTLDLVSIK